MAVREEIAENGASHQIERSLRDARDRRSNGIDRRQQRMDARSLGFPDRRRGPRRLEDLRDPRWPRWLVAVASAGLGLAAAGWWTTDMSQAQPTRPIPAAVAPPTHVREVTDALRGELEQIRDEAEALTPTEVMLDERVRERWLLEAERLADLCQQPGLPSDVRAELDGTLQALERASVLR